MLSFRASQKKSKNSWHQNRLNNPPNLPLMQIKNRIRSIWNPLVKTWRRKIYSFSKFRLKTRHYNSSCRNQLKSSKIAQQKTKSCLIWLNYYPYRSNGSMNNLRLWRHRTRQKMSKKHKTQNSGIYLQLLLSRYLERIKRTHKALKAQIKPTLFSYKIRQWFNSMLKQARKINHLP